MENDTIPRLSRHWGALVYVINICRFSLFILIAETVLLNVSQGQDLLLSIGNDSIQAYVLLLGCCVLWAFSLWLWSRTLLEIKFPDTSPNNELLINYRRWVPRGLGGGAFLVVSLSLWNAGGLASQYIWPTLITGLLFIVVTSKRRLIGRWLATKISDQPEQHWLYVAEMDSNAPQFANWRDAYSTVLGKVAAALLGLWAVFYVGGIIAPIYLGDLLNAQMLLMLWGTTFLTVGSILTYWGNKTGVPIMMLLFIMLVVFSHWNDNHAIRPIAGASKPSDRPDIRQALTAWRKVNCAWDKKEKKEVCQPFVIVATAGGGIRAAYWTGIILSHIQDKNSQFKDRLFAISAVSGGAMGASVFRGMLIAKDKGGCKDKLTLCTHKVLSKDFLSPLSVSLLYADLTQWFLPIPLFDDRGVTLEEAFAQSFREQTQLDILSSSFSQLANMDRPWPALFLNAVWTQSGRRSIASSVDFSQESVFIMASDQLQQIGYDIRLITAAHNSARAPYVSPAGSWRQGEDGDVTAGPVQGRIQDGGFYDNYGAMTAMEILSVAREELGALFKPVVIQISSSPGLHTDMSREPPARVGNFLHEFISTFQTVFAVQNGRARELLYQLKRQAKTEGRYAYFRMCKPAGDSNDLPFGWALSNVARKTIQGYLMERSIENEEESLLQADCSEENRQSLKVVLTALK